MDPGAAVAMNYHDDFAPYVHGVRIAGKHLYGRCPFHDDTKASFSANLETGLWNCKAASCGAKGNAHQFTARLQQRTEARIMTQQRTIIATYDYRNEEGDLLFQVVRYHPKNFVQRRRGPDGSWIYNLDGVRRVPYRLHELRAAIHRGERIFLTEGEKDCERVCALGLVATTTAGGAGSWRDEYARYFAGARDVVILPHHDADGEHYAACAAGALFGVVDTVRVLRLPGLAEHGDACDWISAGGTREELDRLIDACLPWVPADHADGADVTPAVGTYHLTDLGNAERLVTHHAADLRYDHTAAAWFVWDGRRWARDTSGEAHRRAKATVRTIYGEATAGADEKTRAAIATWAMRSEADARIEAMLSLARSEAAVTVTASAWNADPWTLNCHNGTLDLRTGELRPHRREDLLTRLAPVAYDPAARCALWDQTLAWALPDPEVRAFFQRAVGYSLTDDTREDKLFFVHGPTGALKSTILEAIKTALGDYAMTADFETFLRRRDVGAPRNDIARLAGARFVLSIEVEQGRRLAEGLIKLLTGGDTVAARFLFREAFEFRPTFKLWLVANHAPRVPDDDDALWRRIVRIPFEHVLPEGERDSTAKAALRDSATAGPAILAWAVEGCRAWQRDGLCVPATVRAATAAYRADMDPLADFFAERCRFDPAAWVAAADLRAAYEEWAKANGERPLAGREFGARLRARGCTDQRLHQGRGWQGIDLTGPDRSAFGPDRDTVTARDASFDNLPTTTEPSRGDTEFAVTRRHAVTPPDGETASDYIEKAIEIFNATVLPDA